ncbi:hypothetical protein L1987_24715 [Smallanthus sonchifolius]|uniref:Uncharacterized protein n=1 Tax=Smallanthus sonchifolius TaxID=185202 RepID=A0ACB9IL61_9ASTR|nr:hypothetical protein L1987_24715 [Smallanthus sonchifolius]
MLFSIALEAIQGCRCTSCRTGLEQRLQCLMSISSFEVCLHVIRLKERCWKMDGPSVFGTLMIIQVATEDVLLLDHLEPRVLTESPTPVEGENADVQHMSAVDAWKHSEFLCRNYVLNGLVDALYNVYCKITTAKELCESLERKYKTEDAGTKKFVVARFLDYKMVDEKTVISQVQELQVILSDIHAEGMVLSETFQVTSMVEKLPPSWVDYKNYLKHKRKEMTIEDLVVRLRNEEDNRLALKVSQVQISTKANMFEHGQSSKSFKGFKKGKGKEKSVNLGPKKGGVAPKHEKAHMVDDDGMPLVAMITEASAMIAVVNIAGDKPQGYALNAMFKLSVMVVKKNMNDKASTSSYMLELNDNIDWHARLGSKTVDCIFIGYAHNSSAYRFLVHESKNPDIHKNTIMEAEHASWFEHVFPCKRQEHTSSSTSVKDEVHDKRHERPEVEEVEPRRSKRQRVEKSFGPDFMTYMVEGEPNTYCQAVTSSEGPQWKEAIKNEIDSILQNHTWELVDLPPGCKPLGYRWIFKRKMKPEGSIEKYKASLVIKGFRQKEGLDYFDTYSPMTRITSIRLVLAIAALRNLEVHQMDVKTAFLNGDLEEEIYIEQPEGFSTPGHEGKV